VTGLFSKFDLRYVFRLVCGAVVFSASMSEAGFSAARPGSLIEWNRNVSGQKAEPFFAEDVFPGGDLVRTRFLKLDPVIDFEKPLANFDTAGWAIYNDTLIGTFADKWLAARSLLNNSFAWWFDMGGELTVPPLVFGNWVVTGNRNGKIYKIDAVTGKPAWELQFDSFSQKKIGRSGNLLFVATTTQSVYAIDQLSGQVKWVYDAGKPDRMTIQSGVGPLAIDDRVFIGTAEGEIHCVSADQGKLLWKFAIPSRMGRFSDVVGELTYANGQLLYARNDGLVVNLDISGDDRRIVWQSEQSAITTSSYRDGKLFLGLLNGDVVMLDAKSGNKIWKFSGGKPVQMVLPGEQTLLAVSSSGLLYGLESGSGALRWYDDVGSRVAASPMVLAKEVLVSTGMRAIYGYRLD